MNRNPESRDISPPAPENNSGHPTLPRRSFLGLAAAVAAGPWPLETGVSMAASTTNQSLRLPAGATASDVVQVTAKKVVDGANIHKSLLREMLELILTAQANQSSLAASWKAILGGAESVGLKFNQSGQYVIGTTEAFAGALIESLIVAGIKSERIVCFEAPPRIVRKFGCRSAGSNYESKPTDFGSGSDNLHAALGGVDALINVPFLKTHNIAGLSGGLKNLSHGLIKHPARYHANACTPFVSDIVSLPEIRKKLRLTIMDALRIVFEGGPEATSHNVADEGSLLGSVDPVAIDAVGLNIINRSRAFRGLSPMAHGPEGIPHLAAAHRGGLGLAVAPGINIRRFEL